MPGRYRDTHPWPLYRACASRRRGSSCGCPDDEDLVELFDAARAGIHPAGRDAVRRALDRRHRGARGAASGFSPSTGPRAARSRPEKWSAAVRRRRGRVASWASRSCWPRTSPDARSVSSGSWLTASAQGRGLGVEMRAAVLHLAFAGLGALEAQTSAWIDNPASQRVSLRLGYVHEGQQLLARRGEPTRAPALPAHARGVAAQPLRRHRDPRPRALPADARRCMNLHLICIIMQQWRPRRHCAARQRRRLRTR